MGRLVPVPQGYTTYDTIMKAHYAIKNALEFEKQALRKQSRGIDTTLDIVRRDKVLAHAVEYIEQLRNELQIPRQNRGVVR